MNLLADLKHLRFSRIALSVSAAALIGASGHKAAQYAQSAWGDEGLVLVVAGAVAAFYGLHTAFNDKARRSARVWAAAAALGLGLLEGGAIMQGNIEAATVAAQNTHTANVQTWQATKTALDTDYHAAYQQWQAEKAHAETDAGNTKTALRQELQSVKDALAENAKSQRTTKASDKEGNVTPAYQALLDQQANLLKRSESINAELGKTVTLPAAPSKPVYPAEPVQAPISLAPVEYAQAFAFPALVVVLMFLRGRRDEENAALAELADIQQAASAVTQKLDTALGNAEQRINALLASIQAEGATATQQIQTLTQGELSALQHHVSQCQRLAAATTTQAETAVATLRHHAHAVTEATHRDLQALATTEQRQHQAQLIQLRDTVAETLKNAEADARAIHHHAMQDATASIQASVTEARATRAELQQQISHCQRLAAAAQSQAETAVKTLQQQAEAVTTATARDLQTNLAQLQATAIETLKNAVTAARAISQRTALETTESLQAVVTDAKTASTDLQKQVIHINTLLAKTTAPALQVNATAMHLQCSSMQVNADGNATALETALTTESDINRKDVKSVSRNDALNLLRLQQLEPNDKGLITSDVIQENTAYKRFTAEKLRDEAIKYGYLLAESHAKGISCRYPATIQPDRHSQDQAPVKTNVFNLVKRG